MSRATLPPPSPLRRLVPLLGALPMLLPLLVPVTAADASGGIDVRRGGSSRARIDEDDRVRIEGRLVRGVEEEGTVRRHGSLRASAAPRCSGLDAVRRVAALLFFFGRGFFGP